MLGTPPDKAVCLSHIAHFFLTSNHMVVPLRTRSLEFHAVSMAPFPRNNRTWQILDAATQGGYAVGAYNWYLICNLHFSGFPVLTGIVITTMV